MEAKPTAEEDLSGQSSERSEAGLSPAIDESLLEAVRLARIGVKVDDSFRVLNAQLGPRLLSYFRAHSFSREDAEDLVQKTLGRVYVGIRQLEQEERFLGWLFAIARNVRRTEVEKRQRERQVIAGGIELAEGVPDPKGESWALDERLEQDRLSAVRAAIEMLPSQQRQCLLLRLRDELSYEEIAAALRLSAKTVRNHLAEARKNLRRLLKAEVEGAF